MCGIAGNINLVGKVSAPAIHAMLLDMQHRGDTAPRVEDLTWAAIGCVRLKIVDGDCASQPMTDKDEVALIAFNGEIYNFLELKSELEELGRVFQYNSDTEVLLHAFLEWGKDCLSRLQGMYAFVILDLRRRSYFAARDPLGIKPFYYGHNGNEWLFSSEIHPLTMSGASDVRSLPGGAFVVDGIVSERTYLPELRPKPSSFNDVRAILRSKIRESVRSHLQTDFPVAVLCSGGIDSSIILYEAFQGKPDLVTAFSVGTINAEDHVFAQRLASKLGIPFVFIEISEQEMVNGISQAVRCIESFEPNHIRAGTTGLALARAVKQHGFKIALLGEGADELFGGYGEFPNALRDEGSLDSVESLLRRFTEELQQTQLQRVDRTMMNSTIEGRVPFLHLPLVRFVQTIPTEFKVTRMEDGRVVSKNILREAYRGILPDEIVDRRKIPMGEGAGIGDNGPRGPFYDFAARAITDAEHLALQEQFPEFRLVTREEAFYFRLFLKQFGALSLATKRPKTNLVATR